MEGRRSGLERPTASGSRRNRVTLFQASTVRFCEDRQIQKESKKLATSEPAIRLMLATMWRWWIMSAVDLGHINVTHAVTIRSFIRSRTKGVRRRGIIFCFRVHHVVMSLCNGPSCLPLCPALQHPLKSWLVLLDGCLACGVVYEGVRLDEDLAWLLVCQDHLPDLGAPEVRLNGRHLAEECTSGLYVRSRLVDVELLEVFSNGCEGFELSESDETVHGMAISGVGALPLRPAVMILDRSRLMVRSDRSSFL